VQAARAFDVKSHSSISTAIVKEYEVNGYRFSYAQSLPSTTPANSHTPDDDRDSREYTLFEEVDDIFKGAKVRYFDDENGVRQISVLDVINVMMGNANPRMNWLRLQSQHENVVSKCYMHRFPGQGSRETSVADITTIIEIINVLPGQRAARFRVAGAKVLVRVLGGDPTLIDEINENAERMLDIKQDLDNPLNIPFR
jgi:hypothetical protein